MSVFTESMARAWQRVAVGRQQQLEQAWKEETYYRVLYQDPPCTLKLGYMVPNSGYLASNRG